MTVFGENGDSSELLLKKSETHINKFEQDQTDVFTFKNILSLGELSKCRIRHDNTGNLLGNSHWHLEYVKIEDISQNKTYVFNCNKWLSLSKEDKQLVRELTPELNEDDRGTPRMGERTEYEITVTTSDERNAGTKENAFIVLIGEKNQESKMKMLENNFESKILRRGQADKFLFRTKSVGVLKRILLGHVKSKDEPLSREERNAEWICHDVKVKDLSTDTTYIFPVQEALILNKEPKTFKCEAKKDSMVNITRNLKNLTYEVTVVTGSEKGAGTSKYFVQFFPNHSSTHFIRQLSGMKSKVL